MFSSMTDAMDKMKIGDHDTDTEEQWRLDIKTTMDKMHGERDLHESCLSFSMFEEEPKREHDLHDTFLQLLDEPTRKPHYTLDFTSTPRDRYFSYKSFIGAAIDAQCIICLRALLKAGASPNYDGTFRYQVRSCRPRPLAYLLISTLYHKIRTGSTRSYNVMSVNDMLKELLVHGADVNAGSDTAEDHHGYPAITLAVLYEHESSSIDILIQSLLDNGARITQKAWEYAVKHQYPLPLRVLLEHAEECKHVIPLRTLFQHLSALHPIEILQNILRWSYIPDKNSSLDRCMFVRVLSAIRPTPVDRVAPASYRGGTPASYRRVTRRRVAPSSYVPPQENPKAKKMVYMILDKSPMLLQACRGSLQDVNLTPEFQHLLATPPSLQNQCKGVIISTIGDGYVTQVQYLPLPQRLKNELTAVKDTDSISDAVRQLK